MCETAWEPKKCLEFLLTVHDISKGISEIDNVQLPEKWIEKLKLNDNEKQKWYKHDGDGLFFRLASGDEDYERGDRGLQLLRLIANCWKHFDRNMAWERRHLECEKERLDDELIRRNSPESAHVTNTPENQLKEIRKLQKWVRPESERKRIENERMRIIREIVAGHEMRQKHDRECEEQSVARKEQNIERKGCNDAIEKMNSSLDEIRQKKYAERYEAIEKMNKECDKLSKRINAIEMTLIENGADLQNSHESSQKPAPLKQELIEKKREREKLMQEGIQQGVEWRKEDDEWWGKELTQREQERWRGRRVRTLEEQRMKRNRHEGELDYKDNVWQDEEGSALFNDATLAADVWNFFQSRFPKFLSEVRAFAEGKSKTSKIFESRCRRYLKLP